MVRTIVILGVLAICAFLAGWFTIDRTDTETTIRFNREEIRADASKAIAKGRELLNKDGTVQQPEDSFVQQPSFDQPYQQPTTDGYNAPYADQPAGTFGGDYNQATRAIPPWQQTPPAPGTQQY